MGGEEENCGKEDTGTDDVRLVEPSEPRLISSWAGREAKKAKSALTSAPDAGGDTFLLPSDNSLII